MTIADSCPVALETILSQTPLLFLDKNALIIRQLGRQDYVAVWHAMQIFTNTRGSETHDELWLVEHPPVFTLGQNGKHEHILRPGNIPLVQTDRGGQVTYHGPGQLVAYVLADIRRLEMGVKQLVNRLESAVVLLLNAYSINAATRCDAPGVYVQGAKISSVGLRIRKGCSFHGLSLNVDMDTQPFTEINPCGFPDLVVTQLADLVKPIDLQKCATQLAQCLINQLGYSNAVTRIPSPLFCEN